MDQAPITYLPVPDLGTKDYIAKKKAGRLIAELGEVIIKQYGEQESIELLAKFKEAEEKKNEDSK